MLPSVLLFFGAVAAYYIARYLWELLRVSNIDKRAVLITGCDSGFGALLANRLAKNGQKVFAGCLTEKAIAEMKKESSLIEAFLLDIRKDDSVAESVKFVKSHLNRAEHLWAVVNNAGVVQVLGPDDWMNFEAYTSTIDVNTFGAMRVIRAFKEMIKDSRGRFVTMTSMAGRVCVPGLGPYSVSKYAMEAYMDTIR
ncbi:hypothetical protein WR25_04035 isoform F [Diploscapter pachys]|uniref:Uncharacterized protein n=1 Tax=Diploscapter pachys TaxID=2018661 RepID=A0A2A2KLX7_9BILA|nr:hypothetical protein WR25_04035 isoform A [Diploscapter pachys]PAV74892.1 hypothetical protein WR25_04035 isoform B [Diploscapter pachys]PAV74893.1 hypothetical protein WR25_04035 isoform C [Diploscapter pachys]PAV74894.1 hypothetical protein WR25_04035 isoform D [Diploscapter pachys]PAV74895.1 hypothetical protein WR25_04035 isoform E [Diploscapter pachys]